MQERNRILEQQVGTLQNQVSELQQSRDAQDAGGWWGTPTRRLGKTDRQAVTHRQ
jgi:hypothetical protein